MQNILSALFALVLSTALSAQNTLIPDKNFEQSLIELGIDTDGIINGQVLTSDVSGITKLDLWWKHISDFPGLEDFVS